MNELEQNGTQAHEADIKELPLTGKPEYPKWRKSQLIDLIEKHRLDIQREKGRNPFKLGDIVYLKSDVASPTYMTIIGFKDDDYDRGYTVTAECAWISKKGKPQTFSVPLAALQNLLTTITQQP